MAGMSLPLCALSIVCRTVPVVRSHTWGAGDKEAVTHSCVSWGQAPYRAHTALPLSLLCKHTLYPNPIAHLERAEVVGREEEGV